eukprot:Colp12_sorted_trinity150504_noHs@20806
MGSLMFSAVRLSVGMLSGRVESHVCADSSRPCIQAGLVACWAWSSLDVVETARSSSSFNVWILSSFVPNAWPWVVRRTFSALWGKPSHDGDCCSSRASTHCTNCDRLLPSGILTTVTPLSLWTPSTNGKSTSKLQGVNRRCTNVASSRWSNSLSTRPPYTLSASSTRRASQGMASGAMFARACAEPSSHVSTVSMAHLRSDSLNSYFLAHPRGAYRRRSCTTACSHASRKYKRPRSRGALSMRAGAMRARVCRRLALMPGGGSNTSTSLTRSNLLGTLGLISMVMKRRKLGLGVREWIFFSRELSHEGARCTFFSTTQSPLLAALLIALSACPKPSAEPIAIEASLLFCARASSSTLPLASYPGAEQRRMGVPAFTWTCLRSRSISPARMKLLGNTEATKWAAAAKRRSGRNTFTTRRRRKDDVTAVSRSSLVQHSGTRLSAKVAPRNPCQSWAWEVMWAASPLNAGRDSSWDARTVCSSSSTPPASSGSFLAMTSAPLRKQLYSSLWRGWLRLLR